MYAVVKKGVEIFDRRLKPNAYFMYEEDGSFFYNLVFTIDMQAALNRRLYGIAAYITNDSSYDSFKSTVDIFQSMNMTPKDATSAILNYQNAEMTNHILLESESNKGFLELISHTKNLDIKKYKENIRGTEVDKFGEETKRIVMRESPKTNFIKVESSNANSVVRKISKKSVINGLVEGQGLINIMGYETMKTKSPLDRHVITSKESRIKEKIKANTNKEESQKFKEVFEDRVGASSARIPGERVRKIKTSRRNMTMNFVLRIPTKRMRDFKIKRNEFYLAFEALEKTGNFALDTLMVKINLQRDRVYSEMSTDGLSISSSSTSKKEHAFVIDNKTRNEVDFNVYYKNIKLLSPIFHNHFRQVTNLHLPRSKKNHEILLTKRNTKNTRSTTTYTPDRYGSPHFIRITPTVNGVVLDNCFESGIASLSRTKNNFIPFYVLANQKDKRMEIRVINAPIDPDIVKVKPVKRNLTRHPYGRSDTFKPCLDENFKEVKSRAIKGLKTLIFNDYDVNRDDVYEYRLEITRRINSTKKDYSFSSFTEKYEKAQGSVGLSVTNSTISKSSAMLNVTAQTVNSDVDLLFKTLLGDKFDAFQDEFAEIKDSSTAAIAIHVDRIDKNTGNNKSLGIIIGEKQADSVFTFLVTDSFGDDYGDSESDVHNVKQKSVNIIYKLTALAAPVAEMVATINQEIALRSQKDIGKKLNYYSFTSLKKKIQELETSELSALSSKFSTSIGGTKLLVDESTLATMNNGSVMASASTGDVFYHSPETIHLDPGGTSPHQGFVTFNKSGILYYPSLAKKKMAGNKFNNSRLLHKFVIEINARFESRIDHCAIFSLRNKRLNFECTIHVDAQKDKYKALIEKERVDGSTEFILYPVTSQGVVLNHIVLGKYTQ
jgi:hypothetical protein